MKTDYFDMTSIEIRVAMMRARTTQAEIARRVGCNRVSVCHVIDGKVVSHRIRLAIAEAIRIPVENIWRSYYLSCKQDKRGRRISRSNQPLTAAL